MYESVVRERRGESQRGNMSRGGRGPTFSCRHKQSECVLLTLKQAAHLPVHIWFSCWCQDISCKTTVIDTLRGKVIFTTNQESAHSADVSGTHAHFSFFFFIISSPFTNLTFSHMLLMLSWEFTRRGGSDWRREEEESEV